MHEEKIKVDWGTECLENETFPRLDYRELVEFDKVTKKLQFLVIEHLLTSVTPI